MDKTLSTRQGLVERPTTMMEGGAAERQAALGEAQRLAMEWLMGGGSVTEASQYAGVCRQTVSEWLNHDELFRRVFQEWQIHVRTMNHARLIALSESAMETVAKAIREDKNSKVALVVLKSLGMLGEGM